METVNETPEPHGSSDRKARARTLSDRAYERVLQKIIEGDIPVGSRLPTEHALSEEFGVSRPVLRQALRQLREDEIIVSRQGSGSFVKRRPEGLLLNFSPVGSIADIQRTFEFRMSIDGEAAYLAARRRTDDDLYRMKTILEQLDQAANAGELNLAADEDFHVAVCEASDNKYFVAARVSMRSNILTGMNLMRNLSMTKPLETLRIVQEEHYEIFRAIEAGDQETAQKAMRHHVENARKRVFEGTV